MGVNQAIRNTHMQKRPVTLTEAIQEAMRLELINESNGTKNKIVNLADVDDKDLSAIVEDLDDLTIKGTNTRRAKSGRQPSRQTSQFTGSKGKGGKGKTGGDKSAVKCCNSNK
jgi:predicted ATP-binding protein involved in virulence